MMISIHMKNVKFEVITQEDKAKEIWDLFSPKKRIDDDWNFRNTWTEKLDFPFHFIVGYEGDKPIGLLPLQLNTLKGLGPKLLQMNIPYLEFFAGIDTDDNDVWVLPGYEEYKEDFIKQITQPAVLTSLKNQYKFENVEATHYLDRFELDLTPYTSFDDFLKTKLDGVSRQRLINRTNKIHRNYTVEVSDGSADDLQQMFQFSIDRFGERSSFNMQQRRDVFKALYERFDVDLFVIKLNGEPKAISFAFMYNGSYITLNIGYDYDVRDISKLLVVTQLSRAIEKGCTRFDAGQGDNGWKSHFNLEKVSQYKLTLNVPDVPEE